MLFGFSITIKNADWFLNYNKECWLKPQLQYRMLISDCASITIKNADWCLDYNKECWSLIGALVTIKNADWCLNYNNADQGCAPIGCTKFCNAFFTSLRHLYASICTHFHKFFCVHFVVWSFVHSCVFSKVYVILSISFLALWLISLCMSAYLNRCYNSSLFLSLPYIRRAKWKIWWKTALKPQAPPVLVSETHSANIYFLLIESNCTEIIIKFVTRKVNIKFMI